MTEVVTRINGSAPAHAQTFDVRSPATGEIVGTFPVHGASDVAASVDRARVAAQWWSLTYSERATRLDRWRSEIVRGTSELATLIGLRSVPSSLISINQAASVEFPPLGVVGVIGPWNYPVFTPLSSLSFALAAGNAVVFKPSEYTQGVGAWLVEAFGRAVPEHPVLQLVTGAAETGAALCRSGVDKIGFTGSTATGKKVMAACAETLTPVLMECGGTSTRRCTTPLWPRLCGRHERSTPPPIPRQRSARSPCPRRSRSSAGTLPTPLERGGNAVLGGLNTINGQFVQPTILVDVPEDSLAVTEETFGPTLTVAKVADMDEAVDLVNASRYGLGATVFAKRNGVEIARRLRVGGVAINAFVAYATIPSLPLGGVGQSGFGRVHGTEGLKEFTYAKAITRQRFPSPLALTTFARTERTDAIAGALVKLLHGRN